MVRVDGPGQPWGGHQYAFGEAAPAISKDGLTLYFVSNRPGVPPDAFGDNDIYVARRESVDLPWDSPVNLGAKINTAAFEGFPALSRNEHHLFFFRAPGTSGSPTGRRSAMTWETTDGSCRYP